jgi:hypothetical protein
MYHNQKSKNVIVDFKKVELVGIQAIKTGNDNKWQKAEGKQKAFFPGYNSQYILHGKFDLLFDFSYLERELRLLYLKKIVELHGMLSMS